MSERPIPSIEDENLNYSYKQFNGNHSFSSYNGKSAPKIYKYGKLNRTEDLKAQEISFKSASMVVSPIKSPLYDADRNSISYFDQCFEVITKLGEGSFGTVYKVRNLEDNKLYAIKESKETYRGHQYRKERLEEAKRYEQLSEHDNCVKLYKTWEQRGRLYMQMELCKYNLNMYVAENKRVPEEKIWKILLDILLVLQALHSRNLLHLDIKLENILLSDDFTCKLGDFGLVIDMDSGCMHKASEGDSRYMAKELLAGKFTKAADIFSLGITLLELSCNLELPNNGTLWQQLRSGIFPQFDDNVISKDLQYIIKWMMKPDPKERPDVQTLLEYKILSKLLMKKKAKKLAMLCINKITMYSLCIVNSMCNLFSKVYKFAYGIFTYIVSSLQLKNMKKDHLTGSVSDDSDIDFSTSKMDINISSSTPIAAKYNNNNLTNKFVKRKRFPSNLNISCTDVINKSTNNNNNNDNNNNNNNNSNNNNNHIDNNDKYNRNNDKNNNSYNSSYENISMSRKKIIF